MSDSPPAESEHGHPGIVLATLATANVMALLDMFVVNVALHDIGVSLHYQSSLSDVAWVLNAYALFFGALLIPAGRFADKYGRKATFMAGLAVFTAASLACAISPNLWVLVGFRSVQAIGAAMLIPSSLGLVLTTIPPDRVKRGVRLWTVTGAAAGSLGPVVGGLLTSLSWRWIFAINLPIGIAAVLVTWKMIPDVRHDRSARIPDLLGSLMIVVTIGAVSLGLLNGAGWGWGSGKIIASWITAAAAALAFVISTRRAAVPVIDPRMFQSRAFTAANIAIVIAATIFGMQLLGLSLFLQQSWHWSVITTGLAIAPGPAAVVGSSFIAQRFNQRFPVGAVVAFGFAVIEAGQVLMLLTLRHGIHNYARSDLARLDTDRDWLRLHHADHHRVRSARPAAAVERHRQRRGQQRPSNRRRFRSFHLGGHSRQGRGHRRPQPLLRPVVGCRRPLRSRRPRLPRAHAQTSPREWGRGRTGRQRGRTCRRHDRRFSGMTSNHTHPDRVLAPGALPGRQLGLCRGWRPAARQKAGLTAPEPRTPTRRNTQEHQRRKTPWKVSARDESTERQRIHDERTRRKNGAGHGC